MKRQNGFLMPPQMLNSSGEMRDVGFELEYGVLGLEETAGPIVHTLVSKIENDNEFLYKVTETKFREFALEVDADLLKNKAL
jgi:hypothetical protein